MSATTTHDPMPEPRSTPSTPLAEELAEYLENVEEHIEGKLGSLASCGVAEESESHAPEAPPG